jgi:hypothetical protein
MFTIQIPEKEASVHYWIDDKIEVLVFWESDELFVVNSICPHMGAKLDYNRDTGVISCPWHGLSALPADCKTHHKKFKSFYKWKVSSITGSTATIERA